MKREEYLKQLKEKVDRIILKDPSEYIYEERWYLWKYKVMTSPPDAPYDVGEERELFDGNALANNEIKNGFGSDFPEWFREAGRHFGQRCKLPDNKIYTLIGMSETFEDYYYIVIDENGKKHYHSSVGKIEYL